MWVLGQKGVQTLDSLVVQFHLRKGNLDRCPFRLKPIDTFPLTRHITQLHLTVVVLLVGFGVLSLRKAQLGFFLVKQESKKRVKITITWVQGTNDGRQTRPAHRTVRHGVIARCRPSRSALSFQFIQQQQGMLGTELFRVLGVTRHAGGSEIRLRIEGEGGHVHLCRNARNVHLLAGAAYLAFEFGQTASVRRGPTGTPPPVYLLCGFIHKRVHAGGNDVMLQQQKFIVPVLLQIRFTPFDEHLVV
ncbi:hypothetical protein AGDE_13036 [Angomonas deanei]|uniref:Uncharacterized protein n=1 Tax=Angomonas deanei TaxID=59799 RepID=A0A7G2CCD8_9TRYP|nr:hypothetical protein AGDE_13036 [Angomonas deanei]CAD2215742.1 hypothetical protein, conserved [Angomonas deanei]|eukprot:EPY23106.1 hypothetical protein AGDE_13036 [Angomonas deanei]